MIGVVAPTAFDLMQKATIVATMIGSTISIASAISWVSTIAPIAITTCCWYSGMESNYLMRLNRARNIEYNHTVWEASVG